MKYEYRKSLTYAQWLLAALFCAVLLFVFWLVGVKEKILLETGVFSIGLFVVQYIRFSPEMLKRYVELFDNYIRFNSFRFRDVKMKPAVSFNVNYEDVLSIEAKKLPLIGIWAISVEAKKLPHKITLSFCFAKHKELTRNLCSYVKKHNPDAYVDMRLTEYIEV